MACFEGQGKRQPVSKDADGLYLFCVKAIVHNSSDELMVVHCKFEGATDDMHDKGLLMTGGCQWSAGLQCHTIPQVSSRRIGLDHEGGWARCNITLLQVSRLGQFRLHA